MAANGFAVIKNSPVSGRGLFATKDLQAGELIFSIERPLVCVLDGTHLDDTCANCFVSSQGPPIGRTVRDVDDVQLKACARCKQMKFCGKVNTTENHWHFTALRHTHGAPRNAKQEHGKDSTNSNAIHGVQRMRNNPKMSL